MYTIYAYFNADQIKGVLNAVVMLMGSSAGVDGDYMDLLRVAATLGLMVATAYGFARARGEDAGHYLVMVALFYGLLFTPRVTVTIQEVAGTGAPQTVNNVPIGLAFFASTTSKIGHWLTDKSETFFALPDAELNFARHGLMGASRALREANSASVQDPVLQQNLTNFMRDCINPEIVMAPASLTALVQSTNIWSDISTLGLLNPGRMVTLVDTGSVQDCDVAYATLGAKLPAQVSAEQARIAQLLSPNSTPANANTILISMLPAAEGMIMTASASAADALKQRMMINVLNDNTRSMAQVMNDPSAAQQALAISMATQSANSSYQVMAKLASETLPIVRNAIELVIVGVFPILLILIIIAGAKGGVVLKSYVLTMLWVQLWAPLYAIVNYVGTLSAAKSMKATLEGIDGVSVLNAAALLNSTISAEAVVGLLTISVPIIALALVKGGEVAMSGMVSSIMGPAQQAAAKAGEHAGLGNVNAGNMKWGTYSANTTTANKTDTDVGYKSGAAAIRGWNGETTTTYGDGTQTLAQPKNDVYLSGQSAAGIGRELQAQAQRSITSAVTDIKSALKAHSAALTEMAAHGELGGITNTNSAGHGVSQSGTYTLANQGNVSNGQTTTGSATMNMGNTAAFSGNIAGRVGAGGGAQESARDGTSADLTESKTATTGKPGAARGAAAGQGENPSVQESRSAKRTASSAHGKEKNIGAKANLDAGMDVAQRYTAAVGKKLETNDTAGALQLVQEMGQYLDQAHRESGFNHQTQGSTTNRAGIEAKLGQANTYASSAAASLQEANSYQEASRIMQNQGVNVGYNDPSDPHRFTPAQIQTLTAAYRNASPEERQAILSNLAHALGGDLGSKHAPAHLSGAPVLGSAGAVREDAREKAAESRVADKAKSDHGGFSKKVPHSAPVGASAVTPDQKEVAAVNAQIDGTRSAAQDAQKMLETNKANKGQHVEAQTGFVNPSPWNLPQARE